MAGSARGDAGARGYLSGRPVALVECGDIADPRDVDTPDQLARAQLDQPG